jgi:hypothetical protein
MVDLKVHNLDDVVASALKARAKAKGRLARGGGTPDVYSLGCGRSRVAGEAARALHAAAGGAPGEPEFDNARTMREDRDAWG